VLIIIVPIFDLDRPFRKVNLEKVQKKSKNLYSKLHRNPAIYNAVITFCAVNYYCVTNSIECRVLDKILRTESTEVTLVIKKHACFMACSVLTFYNQSQYFCGTL